MNINEETSKPFISSTMNSNSVTTEMRTLKEKLIDKKCLYRYISLAIVFGLLLIMIILMIITTAKLVQLQNENIVLRTEMEKIKRHIGLDELEDETTLDSMDYDENASNYIDALEFDKLEGIDEEYEYDADGHDGHHTENEDDEDDNNNNNGDDVDVDNDDDDDDDILHGSGDKINSADNENITEDEKTINDKIHIEDIKLRKKRESVTRQGVPIIEESYAVRRNKTHTPIDGIVENILLKKDKPKLNYDWTEKQDISPESPAAHLLHHYPKKYHEYNSSPISYVLPPHSRTSNKHLSSSSSSSNGRDGIYSSHPSMPPRNHHRNGNNVIRSHNNGNGQMATGNQYNLNDDRLGQDSLNDNTHSINGNNIISNSISKSSSSSSNTTTTATQRTEHIVYNRHSRVMNTNEDKSKAFRQFIRKSDFDKMEKYYGQNLALNGNNDQHTVQPMNDDQSINNKNLINKRKPMRKSMNNQRFNRVLAIQYNANFTDSKARKDMKFDGNGKMRNAGIFKEWSPAAWADTSILNRFRMDQGLLYVFEKGLYVIYVQIFYHDAADTNGYHVKHNSNTILQCTVSAQKNDRVLKSNTCFTSGIAYIQAGDHISVSGIGVLFDSNLSFFGMYKIGDLPYQQQPQQQHVLH